MLAEGTEVGRYRVESLLGAGGMGEVYRAYDTVLRRHVALKVLRPELSDASARLLREARAAAALGHPGAVALFDVGEANGMSFIAMELVAGAPLRSFVGDRSVPLARRLRWLADVARVLAAAHDKGFVHRDIKPENVMVGPDDAVKVLDFGIAKQAGAASPKYPETDSGPASFRTAEGRVTGTPRYMAPEQLAGGPVDGRTDQYAWGAMAYELLAGVHPRSISDAATTPEMLNHRVPEVPFEIAAAVTRALAPAAELRFATMAEIVSICDVAVKSLTSLASSASSAPGTPSATPPPGVGARRLVRVRDPRGGVVLRLLPPALALTAIAVGLAGVLLRPARGVDFVGFLVLVVGFVTLYAWPLLGLRRAPRVAEVFYERGRIVIRRAGTWSQTVSTVTGASIATLAAGGASVVLARSQADVAVELEFAEPSEARAVLSSLGVGESPSGRVCWSLGRGPFEWLTLALGVGWRLAWPAVLVLTVAASPVVAGGAAVTAIVVSVLAFVGACVLPRSGAFVALTPAGLELYAQIALGDGSPPRAQRRFVSREELVHARADSGGLALDLRDGTTLTVACAPVRLSARGLTAAELAALAAHVEAMATVGRTAASEAMLTGDDVEGRDRVPGNSERPTV